MIQSVIILNSGKSTQRGVWGFSPRKFLKKSVKKVQFGVHFTLKELSRHEMKIQVLMKRGKLLAVPKKFCQVPSHFTRCQIWHLAPILETLDYMGGAKVAFVALLVNEFRSLVKVTSYCGWNIHRYYTLLCFTHGQEVTPPPPRYCRVPPPIGLQVMVV